MLVNHVLPNGNQSAIFAAIFRYFAEYAPEGVRIEVTSSRLPNADVHHFHRPHLEHQLGDCAVVTVHHDLHDPDPWLDQDTFIARYREAKLIICLNETQREILAGRGITHTVVIPHGYNDKVLRLKAGTSNAGRQKIVLGLFSTYYERRVKGEAYLMELAKRLSPDRFAWLLVGARRHTTAERLTELGYDVRVFDYFPYRIFQELYEAVDFLLMCSNFEGGPANVPEALATGTPVLARPVGMASDLVRDGENGLLLSGDSDVDAERIARLASPGDELPMQLMDGAAASRESLVTWREVIERHVDAYSSAIARNKS